MIADMRLDAVRTLACLAGFFGEAKLIAERTFIGQNDAGIYTKRRFHLIEDWRPDAGNQPKNLDVVMLGGETDYEGERLRIEDSSEKYVVGRRYVLITGGRLGTNYKTVFHDPYFIQLDEGTLLPARGWTPFVSGASSTKAKEDIAEALSLLKC